MKCVAAPTQKSPSCTMCNILGCCVFVVTPANTHSDPESANGGCIRFSFQPSSLQENVLPQGLERTSSTWKEAGRSAASWFLHADLETFSLEAD